MRESLMMMRFGVNGSLASFNSMKPNRIKQTAKTPKERVVSLSAQEMLPPLSSASKRKKTARMRVTAPPKSTRLSLERKSEDSLSGR